MFRKKLARILSLFVSSFLFIIIAVLLTACGSSGGGGNTDPGTTNNESNSVGSNGGNVTSSDGKAKIVIPSGALSQDSGITVAVVSNQPSGNIGTAYEFGPDGTTFNHPVTISITYDEASLPSGVNESDIKLGMVKNNQWQEITNSNVDTVANLVSGTTSHLSTYGVMAVSSSVTVPTPPTVVTVAAADGKATISWDDVSGAASYNIYWSTTSGVSKTSYTGKITDATSPYPHTGLTNGTNYYYVLTAMNSYGESSESNQVSATPQATDTTSPNNPTSITCYGNSNKAAVLTPDNWYSYDTPYFEWNGSSDNGSGVAGYYVYLGIDAAADPTTSGTYQTSANYTVGSVLTSGSTYYLLIKANDNAGNIASSTYTAFTYRYDSTGPNNTTGGNFIDSGASSTNSTAVTLTLSATDNAGVRGYCAKESSAIPSGNDTCWTSITSITSYSVGVSFILSSGEGTKTVYVWFKDAAGNISSLANDSIMLGFPPSAPTGVTASVGDGQVSLSWNAVSSATSYNIYWSTTSGATKSTGTKISNVTSPYIHMGRANGITYYYVVTAINSYGESSESSQVSGTPTPSLFSDTTAPSNTTASNFINGGAALTNLSNVTLSISATDNVGVTGYYVSEISTTPSTGAAGWASVTSVTSYSTNVFFTMSSGDGPKTLYVWFKDSAGNVSTSKSATIILDTTAPSNPTTISSYNSSGKTAALTSDNWYNYATPYFEWSGASDSSSGVAGYYVYFGTDATAAPATSGTYQTSANYTISIPLTSGSTYYLFIKAKDNAGNIASSTYTVFTYKYDSSGPTNTTTDNFIDSGASSTNSTTVTLTLSATDDAGITGYCAKESSVAPSSNDICWTSITSTTSYSTGVTFTLSNGEGIKTVYVWFKDAAGNISSGTNDSITLGSPPSAPTGVTATVSDGQVTLSWNTVSDATSYNIYWSTTSGVKKSTGTKISNFINPYTHTGRTNGATYYYVVTAVNEFGESSESRQVMVVPPNIPISLPKTGQTTCYDSLGNVIACLGTGQDGDIQAGVAWPDPRFADNGDGTVTDNLTGLIWTKDTNAPGPAVCSPANRKTWQGALDYVTCLNANGYLGYTDWHLPNINELKSLLNAGQIDSGVWLETQGFNNAPSGAYWSSTTYAGWPSFAWFVKLSDGLMDSASKSGNGYYVWAVRSGQFGLFGNSVISLPKTGQTICYDGWTGTIIACTGTGQDGDIQAGVPWPSPRFTDNGNGIVTDNLTGLIWTKDAYTPGPSTCAPASLKTRQGALDYVACLNTNNYLGYTDWRLPNVIELGGLLNRELGNSRAWLNTQGFNNVQSYFYWSSTTVAIRPSSAWYISMWDGSMVSHIEPLDYYYVWPVRSEP